MLEINTARELKIHADGIYPNLSEEDYHADPALGSSGIKDLLQSPLKYWVNSPYNPNRNDEDESTDATTLGDMLHDRLLEGGKKIYAVKPEGMSFSTKAGKEWRQNAWDDGRTIITHKMQKTWLTMSAAIEMSGAGDFFQNGLPEVSFFWTDKDGIRRKIRLDWLSTHHAVDLKSYANTMNKDLETAIAHSVANYRYSISAYWYMHGIKAMREMLAKRGLEAFPNDVKREDFKIFEAIMANDEPRFPLYFVFAETGDVPNITIRNFESHCSNGGGLNAYWRYAKMSVEVALHQFKVNMTSHGPDQIWIDKAIVKPFDDADFAAARWILAEE